MKERLIKVGMVIIAIPCVILIILAHVLIPIWIIVWIITGWNFYDEFEDDTSAAGF